MCQKIICLRYIIYEKLIKIIFIDNVGIVPVRYRLIMILKT